MGFVGGLLGSSSGSNFQADGTRIDKPLGTLEGQQAQMQSLKALGGQDAFVNALNAQNGIGNQSNVFNQMQGVADGTGPNPAMAQLANTTGQNINAQAALMAGQRGAGANAGLLARQAAMQGGALQQQAAGQGAALQSQQQLNALNQLGSIAGQQVNQQATALQNQGQLRQNQQNIVNNQLNNQNSAGIQMQSNINSANASIAQKNQQTQSDLFGGALGSLGTAATSLATKAAPAAALAHGGSVPHYATGGGVAPVGAEGPQSFAAKYFSGQQQMAPSAPSSSMSMAGRGGAAVGNAIGAGIGSLFQSAPEAPAPVWGNKASDYTSLPEAGVWGNNSADYAALPDAQPLMAEEMVQGAIPAADQGMASDYMMASSGGKVPGKAMVKGDSYSNDTVDAKLSPGEIVIPRSILQGKNPVEMAAKFVKQELLKQHKSKKNNFADGGTATDEQKPVVVNVNNGPAPQAEAAPAPAPAADPRADFYAQRQAMLEAKNPAFKPEPVDNRAADFYSQRKQDLAAGVPYQAGSAPIAMGQPGPLMASTSSAPTANTGGSLGGGELGAASSAQAPAANPAPDAQGIYKQAMNEQIAGAKGEAQATQDLARSQVAIEQQHQAQLQQKQEEFQRSYEQKETERKKFESDIANGHIDPNRYVGDMSTGQKFATAIGLILGGMGGGITHQENPAMKFLNNQIENDVKAQQLDLGKKENLLSMNMKASGDLRQALADTRVQLATMAESKMREAMAKASDPLAKARMQKEIGVLHNTFAPQQIESAKLAMLLKGGGNGGAADPGELVRTFIPKEEHNEAFKELKEYQDKKAMERNLSTAFDTVSKNRSIFQSPSFRSTAQNAMNAGIAELSKDATGRFNSDENKKLEAQFKPGYFDNADAVKLRLKEMQSQLRQKANYPRLQKIMPLLERGSAGSSAAAEPEIKTVNGVRYMRGPKGEAIRI